MGPDGFMGSKVEGKPGMCQKVKMLAGDQRLSGFGNQ